MCLKIHLKLYYKMLRLKSVCGIEFWIFRKGFLMEVTLDLYIKTLNGDNGCTSQCITLERALGEQS